MNFIELFLVDIPNFHVKLNMLQLQLGIRLGYVATIVTEPRPGHEASATTKVYDTNIKIILLINCTYMNSIDDFTAEVKKRRSLKSPFRFKISS